MHECIDSGRWKSFHVFSFPVIWLLFLFFSHHCFKHCLTTPTAFHTPHMVTQPLMLLLWSVLMSWLPHSLTLFKLLVCSKERITGWLWFILTPVSALWLAQSWHEDTRTHALQPYCADLFSWLVCCTPDTGEEPEQTSDILELQCRDVIRHGGYQLCFFTDYYSALC